MFQLCFEDTDIQDFSTKCLSLLVQLFGGENKDSMTPENMVTFLTILHLVQNTKLIYMGFLFLKLSLAYLNQRIVCGMVSTICMPIHLSTNYTLFFSRSHMTNFGKKGEWIFYIKGHTLREGDGVIKKSFFWGWCLKMVFSRTTCIANIYNFIQC